MNDKNVYGGKLALCNGKKITGYNRSGYCQLVSGDQGTHIVCSRMTKEFLNFTLSRGNDLITPRGSFPGLVEGDYWCICVLRWLEAYKANPRYAPPIVGEATNKKILTYVPAKVVQTYLI
jgi:hypothetical protein